MNKMAKFSIQLYVFGSQQLTTSEKLYYDASNYVYNIIMLDFTKRWPTLFTRVMNLFEIRKLT